jgi:hypothetical protein
VSDVGVSVRKVSVVQISVDQETASLIASLLLHVNWDQFPVAETLRGAIYDAADIDDIDLKFDEDSGDFVKA